jgi:TRAP-type mannitol/chloroaromatic compound transport system substrate-binding protein
MNRLAFSITIAAAAAGMTGLADPLAATELKLAHFMSPKHVIHDAVMAPLAEEVAAATDGTLTIRIYPGGELGAGPQQQYMRGSTASPRSPSVYRATLRPSFPRDHADPTARHRRHPGRGHRDALERL